MYIVPQIFKDPLYSLPIRTLPPIQDTMALTTELGRQPQLREVAGIPLQASTVDNWSQIQNFEAKPDDLLICTYPKSGNYGTRGTERPWPTESAWASHISWNFP